MISAMLRSRRLLLAGLALVAWPWACGQNHDALKQKNPPATGGSAGEAGVDAQPDGDADAAEADAPGDAFVEPPGAPVLTLMHGVVDAQRIAFCFAKVNAGVPAPPTGSPDPAGGLAFGTPLVLTSIAGFDWDVDDIQPIVVTGDFSLLAGKTCSEVIALADYYADAGAGDDAGQADAGDAGASDASLDAESSAADAETEPPPPPPARALAMPVLPAGTLSGGYSNLLVATGCIGGPGFTDSYETFICGQSYTPTTPTLSPVLVQLSRVADASSVGLSVVIAALASDPIDLVSTAPEGSSFSDIHIAYGTVYGAIAPKPPLFGHPKAAFGSPFGSAVLEVNSLGSSAPFYTQEWSTALAASGLSDVSEGRTYAIVLVGPRPNNLEMKWWNGPRLVAIPTAP
jgi:hypothetical protein